MSRAQGWLAIVLGFITLLTLVWRISSGFSKVNTTLEMSIQENFKDHNRLKNELDGVSRRQQHNTSRLGHLEGFLKQHLSERPDDDE